MRGNNIRVIICAARVTLLGQTGNCVRRAIDANEEEGKEEDRKIGGVGEGPKGAKFNKRIHSALISRKLVDTPCRRTIPSLFLGCT